MTRKQWIILVLLVLSALVPVFSSGKKSIKPNSPEQSSSQENDSLSSLNDSGLLADGTTGGSLVPRADRALAKLSDLARLGPAPERISVDDILKQTQFTPATIEQNSLPSIAAPSATPTLVAKQEEVTPQIAIKESSSLPAGEKPAVGDLNYPAEIEKLQLQIVSLESKMNEQKYSYENRVRDLTSKLDIQQSENVKLAHQIQETENRSANQMKETQGKSAEAQKLSKSVKDLESRLDKSRADLAEQKKLIEDSRSTRADFAKKIEEEQKIRKSIENQLELAINKREEQLKDNEKLRRVVGDFERRVKLIEEQRLAVSEDKEQVLLKQLAGVRKELTAAQGALDDLKKKQKNQSSEVTTAQSKAETVQKQIEAKQRENDELSIRLATAERLNEKSKDLQQELVAARNELMLAQEQVKTLRSTSKNPSAEYQNRNYPRTENIQPPRNERPDIAPRATAAAASSDYLTIEVTAQKAALRAGAGEENSTVMEIQQGSRLMVETREGDWYRVITPKGQRAYLRADLAVELDANGRPRFSRPTTKPVGRSVSPNRAPMNNVGPVNPPDSDPLVELLGRQLKDRQKSPPKDDSLDVDIAAPSSATSDAPSSQNGEDEMEAFETLKQGIKKEAQ